MIKYITLFILTAFIAMPTSAFYQTGGINENVINLSRSEHLIRQLNCPVCNGQNLYESQNPIALNIKAYIRHAVTEGKTDSEIITTLIANYGEEIQQTSPFNSTSFLLWGLPWFALIGFLAWYNRKHPNVPNIAHPNNWKNIKFNDNQGKEKQ